MPWKIVYHPVERIVETRYEGTLPPEDLVDAAAHTLATARDHRTQLLLADCTGLTGGHSIMDLYAIADLIESLEPKDRPKEAVLLPRDALSAQDVGFWENLCRNRGILVRVFDDRAAAVAWLVKPAWEA
jgi:hypothetical protein